MEIRKNKEQYMEELWRWLCETEETELSEMGEFFSARVDGYEEHMSVWGEAYRRFARLIPKGCGRILDLGCGTGLELDEIFKLYPEINVTGVDLCRDMLDRLEEKHRGRKLRTVCQDYFQYEMGENCQDVVISFESFHHFLPEKKEQLYRKIYRALRPGGVFLLCDYIACCQEEEDLLRNTFIERRKKWGIPPEQFVHFDIPLTLDHETGLLLEAGFQRAEGFDCVNGATFIRAGKEG